MVKLHKAMSELVPDSLGGCAAELEAMAEKGHERPKWSLTLLDRTWLVKQTKKAIETGRRCQGVVS